MQDPTDTSRGEVIVTFRGEPVKLRPSLEVLEAIEAETGDAVSDLVAKIGEMRLQFRPLCKIILACLRAGGVSTTLDEVRTQVYKDGLLAWTLPVSRVLAGTCYGGKAAEELAKLDPPKALPG